MKEPARDEVGCQDQVADQLALHAQIKVQGGRGFIKRIRQIGTGLVEIEVAESEIAVVRAELSQQICANAGQDCNQISTGKGGRPCRELQRAALIKDAGARDNLSARTYRRQREPIVGNSIRVEDERVEVASRATTNHCLAVVCRRPSEAKGGREIGFLRGTGIQIV